MQTSVSRFAVVICLPFSACESFMPTQKADIVRHLNETGDQLARIKTAIAVDPASPYPKLEPFYIAALASADQARVAAENRAGYQKGRLAELPARNSGRMIGLCRDAIERDRAAIRSGGVPPNAAINLESIARTCSLPKVLEDAMK